jgi:hypothetical protein
MPIENVPGAQRVISARSANAHFDPAGQWVQLVCPAIAKVPGLQGLGKDDVLGHSDPAGHWVQFVAPPKLYVPSSHGTGGKAVEGHWKPAEQRIQRVRVSTCGVLVVYPGGHTTGKRWVDSAAEPGLGSVQLTAPPNEYVPVAQTMGDIETSAHLNPGGQRLQVCWPAKEYSPATQP